MSARVSGERRQRGDIHTLDAVALRDHGNLVVETGKWKPRRSPGGRTHPGFHAHSSAAVNDCECKKPRNTGLSRMMLIKSFDNRRGCNWKPEPQIGTLSLAKACAERPRYSFPLKRTHELHRAQQPGDQSTRSLRHLIEPLIFRVLSHPEPTSTNIFK